MGFFLRVCGLLLAVMLFWSTAPPRSMAAESCNDWVGRLVSIQGRVELRHPDHATWSRARLDAKICPGDSLRTGADSRAAVAHQSETIIRLDQLTTITFPRHATPKQNRLHKVLEGITHIFSSTSKELEADAPYVNAAVEGTEFLVAATANESRVLVIAGVVRAANTSGELRLVSGEGAVAGPGEAPRRFLIADPVGAVQWALYYPPILAALADRKGRGIDTVPVPLAKAVKLASRGDEAAALESLRRVPQGNRDATYHVLWGAILLNAGRVDEARAAMEAALAADPSEGLAWSLRAIISVAGNDREKALTAAKKGVELAPDAAAADIALSYALQADMRMEEARDVLLEAVERHPDDALAWARLSETWLALGYRDQALDAAKTAESLAPGLERVQTVVGFAALASFRFDDAARAFRRAIALDSVNPLPRLGLGLALIRRGQLEQGREEMEIAAGLDPGRALVRAYLGKAYFEERRDRYAGRELQRAKELDPEDPTAYLYDAIRKQTVNRPVEALRDIERSIALNDNRAVYRSRLLLDKDLAARSASLGRIYDDLGFEQAGVNAAGRSLALDPANSAAHRFLSDVYLNRPRHEIARVSELLQAQLFQEININPIQPSLNVIDLNLAARGGPATIGFNELTPLFERNQAQLNVTGSVGNLDTVAGETVLSGVYDRISVSAGIFHFKTDGFRVNNDDEQTLANIFAQVALTPELNIQAEYRRREIDQGDVQLNFDPTDFSENDRRRVEEDIARFGVRYTPSPRSSFIASLFWRDSNEEQDFFFFGPDYPPLDAFDRHQGVSLEGQYIYQGDVFRITAGAGGYDFDLTFGDAEYKEEIVQRQTNGYLYGRISLSEDVDGTLGISVERIEEGPLEESQTNPKFGIEWQATPWLSVRAAAFRTLKRALVANQTIEPTTIAGFNQFYDDINGTDAKRYGIGLDFHPTDLVYGGIEASWRDLSVPFIIFDEIEYEEQETQLYRAYLYWAPMDELAVTGEIAYDRFKRDDNPDLYRADPKTVDTFLAPLSLRYFHQSGFFAGVTGTYVDQDVTLSDFSTFEETSDRFFLVDADIGYRFPKRRGAVSLQLFNLFDEQFLYQDESYRSNVQTSPRFVPERMVRASLTLSF